MTEQSAILDGYDARLASLEHREKHLYKYSTALSALRLVTFVLAIIITIILSSASGFIALIAGAVGLFAFFFVVRLHHKKETEKHFVLIKKRIIGNEVASIVKLSNDNYKGDKYIDHEHHFTSDLDVFGPFSLFGLLNRCRTFDGLNVLAQVLSTTPTLADVRVRSEVVKELEPKLDWRTELLSTLYDIEDGSKADTASNVKYVLDADLSFATASLLSKYRGLLPFVWAVLLAMYFYSSDFATLVAIVMVIVNFKITMGYGAKVSAIQNRLSQAGSHLDKYRSALGLIYENDWKSSYIIDLLDKGDNVNKNNKISALRQLKQLSDLLDYRLHMIPSFILNVGLLWDSKICHKLSNWHDENHHNIDGIFHLIGEIETFVSLATWSYNHPHYSYATMDEDYFHLQGERVRHPLIPYADCSPNDFEIMKEQFVGIITGSNMSGKSTFLRTVGLNIILGNCGARVAAARFSFGLVHLITYMRIKDALEESVSTFKSELNRVLKILSLLDKGTPTLILADEMLRGTNSKDKLKGSKAIVQKILAHRSYALIATHDIGLAHLESHQTGISNYYFDIDYADDELVFDYKIKKGICDNFNASFLLSQLGLDV